MSSRATSGEGARGKPAVEPLAAGKAAEPPGWPVDDRRTGSPGTGGESRQPARRGKRRSRCTGSRRRTTATVARTSASSSAAPTTRCPRVRGVPVVTVTSDGCHRCRSRSHNHPAAAGIMARAYLRALPKENWIALKFMAVRAWRHRGLGTGRGIASSAGVHGPDGLQGGRVPGRCRGHRWRRGTLADGTSATWAARSLAGAARVTLSTLCKIWLGVAGPNKVKMMIQRLGNAQNELHRLVNGISEVILWRLCLHYRVAKYVSGF